MRLYERGGFWRQKKKSLLQPISTALCRILYDQIKWEKNLELLLQSLHNCQNQLNVNNCLQYNLIEDGSTVHNFGQCNLLPILYRKDGQRYRSMIYHGQQPRRRTRVEDRGRGTRLDLEVFLRTECKGKSIPHECSAKVSIAQEFLIITWTR